MSLKSAAAIAAVPLLLIAGAGVSALDPFGEEPTLAAEATTTYYTATWCSRIVEVPPEGSIDPCVASAGTLRYAFLQNMVNAGPYKTWAKANPGEMARLRAYLAAPDPAKAPAMTSFFGAAMMQVVQAYGYAQGGPATMPKPNPAVTTGTDRTPPSMPSNLTAEP